MDIELSRAVSEAIRGAQEVVKWLENIESDRELVNLGTLLKLHGDCLILAYETKTLRNELAQLQAVK